MMGGAFLGMALFSDERMSVIGWRIGVVSVGIYCRFSFLALFSWYWEAIHAWMTRVGENVHNGGCVLH